MEYDKNHFTTISTCVLESGEVIVQKKKKEQKTKNKTKN